MICAQASYFLYQPANDGANKNYLITLKDATRQATEWLPGHAEDRGTNHLLQALKSMKKALREYDREAEQAQRADLEALREGKRQERVPSKPLGLIEVEPLTDDDLVDPHHAICIVLFTLIQADQYLREGWMDGDHDIRRPFTLEAAIEAAFHDLPPAHYNRTMAGVPFNLVTNALSRVVAEHVASGPYVREAVGSEVGTWEGPRKPTTPPEPPEAA